MLNEIIEMLEIMENNGGATFKRGKAIEYKTGYQVATEGVETTDILKAAQLILEWATCGVWFSEGVFYVDKSHRVSTKKQAIAEGISANQQSILVWKNKSLIWL